MDAFDGVEARSRCLAFRRRILEVSQRVGALHIAPAFSCLEMTDVIYYGLMERDRDVFLMSKGHGCVSQYVILEQLGILPSEEIERYCTPQGILGAHPDRGTPGVVASTGSLGHGMGLAIGMAYAETLKQTDGLIYLLLSDGELQEGSSWEAAMMAANLKVSNIVALVDLNDFGGMHRMSEYHTAFYPLREKFEAFGWECAEVNGHDAVAIHKAVVNRKGGRPFVLLGRTVKGRGVSYMENVAIWHYRSPNKEEYAQALRELREISQ